MAHRFEENTIVIDGFENGISNSPYAGFTDMRNAEIIQEEGEISVAFSSGVVTLPPVMNAVAFTGVASTNLLTVVDTTGLYDRCALFINTFTGGGLNADNATTAQISYIVQGGGGAGGNARINNDNGTSAAGGGGGADPQFGTTTIGIGTIAVTVGSGGVPSSLTGTSNGGDGGNSVLFGIATSIGGAGGGSSGGFGGGAFSNAGTNSLGGDAGAGGGATTSDTAGSKNGGTGTNAGGNSTETSGSGGGGGSSTANVGGNATSGAAPGLGGDGLAISIDGYSGTFGGGGGGGGANNSSAPITIAAGGDGGGGRGGRNNNGSNIVAPTAGVDTTGGGGGGGATESGAQQAGAFGGSGVVIITYLTGTIQATGGEISYSGPYTIHTFTASGEFEVTAISEQFCYYVRNLTATTFQLSEFPNSEIVDITSDGTGTFTTFQYGNQRALTDNGAPVSYFNAPEIGGVLLVDSSNYVWLWQQTTTGISPFNTLLFLRHTTGIAASSDNQTGVAYWNEYVVLVQQPSIVDALNWSSFVSSNGDYWDITNIKSEENIIALLTFDTAINSLGYLYVFESSNNQMPNYLFKDRVFEAASSTTVTSNEITLLAGQTIIASVATWENQSISGATFDGNAMTNIGGNSSASPFANGFRQFSYTATVDTTGVVVATFGGAVTNRLLNCVCIANLSAIPTEAFIALGSASNAITTTLQRDKPNQVALFFAMTDDFTDLEADMNIGWQTISDNLITGVGNEYLYYFSEGHGYTQTLKRNIPILKAENNTLYWGDGENIIASLNQNAGEIFDPTDSDSFNLNWEALDLPENEIVQSLSDSVGGIIVGADSKKIYPWDTISPSFDSPVNFPEPAVVDFVSTNNLIYAFAGNQGRVYLTNESSATLYRELPGSITGVERPFYFFWDANVGNNELYFSFQSFINSAPNTPLSTTGGVWAINSDTNALRMVQSTRVANAWVRMVNPVADGFAQPYLRPPGQGLLVGYSVGSNYYLDYSISTPHTDYSTYFETEIIDIGSYFNKQTFQHIEYKLGTPMVAGEGIRIYQRSNLSATYVLIAEFTTAGVISDQASINWENVEWVQFKVEMKSVASNPSYVRLRELSLR